MSFRPCLLECLTAPTKHWEALGDNITRMFLVKVLNTHEYTFLSMSLSAFPTKLPKHHFRASLVHTSKLLQFQDLWTTCCRTSKELFYFSVTNFPIIPTFHCCHNAWEKQFAILGKRSVFFSPLFFLLSANPPTTNYDVLLYLRVTVIGPSNRALKIFKLWSEVNLPSSSG